jgi:SAM-dependent methyltransferase
MTNEKKTWAKKNDWNRLTAGKYTKMLAKHEHLWLYLKKFVRKYKIKRVVEVGCGMMPPVRKLVPEWTGVDPNEKTDAIHADFTTMDVETLPECDLFLACGVIEHVDDWRRFLRQIEKVRCRYAVVTFFLPMKEGWMKRRKQYLDGFLYHTFSAKALRRYLDKRNWRYKLVQLCINDVLLIVER